EDRLPRRVDPEAGELAEAEGRRPQRIEHQGIRPVDRDDRRLPLVIKPPPTMPGLILDPVPVVQRSDDASHEDRLALEPVDPPARGSNRRPGPASRAARPPRGS